MRCSICKNSSAFHEEVHLMPRNGLVCGVISLFVGLAFAGGAHADAGLSAPGVDLGFVFKDLGKYPTYDFYLKYEIGRFGPKGRQPHLTRVEPDTLTRLQ